MKRKSDTTTLRLQWDESLLLRMMIADFIQDRYRDAGADKSAVGVFVCREDGKTELVMAPPPNLLGVALSIGKKLGMTEGLDPP